MRTISILGVVVGGLIDVFLSLGLAVIAVLLILHPHLGPSAPPTQEQARTLIADKAMGAWISWTVGALCSVIGGFVSAWIAKRGELLNGALSAWLCVLLGLQGLVTGTAGGAMEIATFAASPLLGLLGGHLRKISRRS